MAFIRNLLILSCLLFIASHAQQPSNCPEQGDGNYGCFDITSQGNCVEVSNQPATYDARWWTKNGLDINIDWSIKCGDIIAYKIQWFNGGWSGWYVPGVNDMDQKVNAKNGLRRMWSYFYDHTHSYIICKPNEKNALRGCQ